MTIGPMGNTSALSGAQNDAANQVRRASAAEKSEKAAGLGATDADAETGERDADGRRMWEAPPQGQDKQGDQDDAPSSEQSPNHQPPKSKDPTGTKGSTLDLSG